MSISKSTKIRKKWQLLHILTLNQLFGPKNLVFSVKTAKIVKNDETAQNLENHGQNMQKLKIDEMA